MFRLPWFLDLRWVRGALTFSATDGESGRETASVSCLPHTSLLQIYRVHAQRKLMLQWTRDLITRLWMKLEFSSYKTNTMWPCWVSDCVILVRFRSTFIDPGKRDLRMGKLQSKHGKKCCNLKHWKSTFWYELFTCGVDIKQKTNDCLFCIPVSDGSEACKRRENPEGEHRFSPLIEICKRW